MENYDTPPVPEDNAAVPETPVSPTPQKRDELAEQKKRCDELNDRYLRLAADFDNYRKRTARDHESLVQHANERFAVDILEIADNLERALKADDDHLRHRCGTDPPAAGRDSCTAWYNTHRCIKKIL